MTRTRKGSKGPGSEPWSNRHERQQPLPYHEDEDMISRDEVLMGREKEYPLTPDLEKNLSRLLAALNLFRGAYGKPMNVSSGYRPGKYNQAAHGALNSSHVTCEACDFHDRDRALTKWCLANLDKLEKFGLWMESPISTPTWVHLQIRAVKNRVFIP